MAEPVSPVIQNNPFPERILGAGNTDAMPLPVFVDEGTPPWRTFVSRWKLTDREIECVKQTGEIYLFVTNQSHPPVRLAFGTILVNENGQVCFPVDEVEDELEKLAR